MLDPQFTFSLPPALVRSDVGMPDPYAGYFGRPEIDAWARLAQAGMTTTVVERNLFICQLAWMKDRLALRPDASLLDRPLLLRQIVVNAQGAPGLMLGAQEFEGGDVTFRAPAGDVAAPPAPPALTSFTITEAARREGYEALRLVLRGLHLDPSQIRLANGPAPRVMGPAGVVQAAAILPALGYILVASVAAYGVYTAGQSYVAAQQEESRQLTERVRVQEKAADGRTAVQVAARHADFTARLGVFERTGVMPPESAAERNPIQVVPHAGGTDPNKWKADLASDIASTAAWTAAGLGALYAAKLGVDALLRGDRGA